MSAGATHDGRVSGRIHQLDAIRGLLAIGVLVYHVGARGTIGLGTYGVYAFFVLSGFALEHVYGEDLDARRFAIHRVVRLAPLWIPVVLVSAVLYGLTDPLRVLLNLTGLFGIVAPGATSVVTGGWSIGIEAVLYVLFVALAWRRLPTPAIAALAAVAFGVRVAWVAWSLPPGTSLDTGWVAYTQAPAFAWFFLAGMVGARFAGRLGWWSLPAGSALIAVAIASGELTGPAGAAMSLAVAAGVCIAGAGPAWRGRPAGAAELLGDASYGTYLLHPLVAFMAGPVIAFTTPILALGIHRYYEVPVGRRLRVPAWSGQRRQPVEVLGPAGRDGVERPRVEGMLADPAPVE